MKFSAERHNLQIGFAAEHDLSTVVDKENYSCKGEFNLSYYLEAFIPNTLLCLNISIICIH